MTPGALHSRGAAMQGLTYAAMHDCQHVRLQRAMDSGPRLQSGRNGNLQGVNCNTAYGEHEHYMAS